jgi:Carboxypeptidase regulatory-like domain/TonB-dependent Receptor Plug Domain
MATARLLRSLPRALVALALVVGPANAQEHTGTITGTVTDEQGQVLPGATITVIGESTGHARSATSDAKGAFLLTALPPGSYTIRAEMANFRTEERKRQVLSATTRLSLPPFRMAVGLGESIVVEGSGTAISTEDSQHTGLITSQQIEQIQVKGRDVTTLMRLVPGVRYEDTVESLGESFGTLVPHVSGQRRDWNTIMVDGVLGNEVGQTNRMAQQINLDAVDEIKVLLNTYRAEYGRGGGAQIQIVSKSGSADYHGNAYYYGRNEKWNANNFFNNLTGRPRPRYRFNTWGANIGGPIPGLNKGGDRKFFFFYSIEAPLTERPGPLRSYRVPTEAERRGDFSQTRDLNGNLIAIRDPATGQDFPGNIVPANRIDPNGLALLNLLPLPNIEGNRNFNYQRQETADNPKVNNVLRLDWKPSANDSLYITYKDWWSDQRGSEVTAGPAKWGWFNTHYLNTDKGGSLNYTKIVRSNLINEAAVGVRRQTEQFHPVDEADWSRLRRADNGYTLGQLYAVNPVDALPKTTFNVPIAGGAEQANFTYENRLVGDGGKAWVFSFRDNLTWVKGSHTFKGGVYLEQLKNTEGQGGVGAGPWSGQFNFSTDSANPLDTRYSYANALLGVFRDYTEVDALPEVQAKRFLLEWYLQDTWKASSRLTVDYGIRFLWYKPWSTSLPAATFVPERYDPARAPRLYQPARINNQNVAFDPVTGQVLPNVYVGSFVPGTGDPTNGMVSNDDPDYPKGFRDSQGIQPEPRLGAAYDLTGDGKTALHASVGLYHNAHITARSMDQSANNPPAVFTPIVYYGTMNTLVGAGSAVRPSSVFALERDAQTPSSYNWSIGVQREIGWGTAIDLTYVGNVTRHLELATNINVVPDGAKFVDQNPQNANPQNPTSPKADTFLRPYLGYEDITLRSNQGTSNYNGLQVQINRRYIRGFQFAIAYTFAKALGVADDDEQLVSAVRPLREWHYAPLAGTQTHNLVINYTWDLPRPSKLFGDNAVVKFLFDDWQLSGENAFASGDWSPVFFTTTNNFDFTGGTGGTGVDVGPGTTTGVRTVRPVLIGDPSGGGDPTPGGSGWIDDAAFARPAGRGDVGNAARYVFRGPGINNWNLSLFKNFPIGSRGTRIQLRLEAYNLLNKTQFGGTTVNSATGGQGIDNTLRFDATGQQINANFGQATAARNARILQGSIRFTF